MKYSNLTPAQKGQLTRTLKILNEFRNDILEQAQNQCPQPCGRIFLHGEPVTFKMLNSVEEEIQDVMRRRLNDSTYMYDWTTPKEFWAMLKN